ncbi:hypothetical protein DB30_00284 [Enhygromyxa salina]|uniref:DUF7793 domain-containing protein n=1 Tax=Enhygromyxa salina TaxID=215803 RepID=A0A0C1ZM87_9BACT|nr:STAS/SEC14 domain-containing protein [Enhygromyxa salina]KIG18599.1 hypothetical protein DB30_00284 [Enhygromyxa salina]
MAAQQVKTKTGVTWLDEEHGILRFVYAAGAECGLEEAKENVVAQLALAQGKQIGILVDIAGAKSVDHAARQHYAESKAFLALALIGGPPIARIIGNIFLAVYGSRDTPTRFFRSDTEAIAWLESFGG